MIELTAPQPFDYAGYYNYFLFYATIAICFGPFQPIVLPVAALYFWLDGFLKKYLILYVFITKYESGGMFWRTLYNRTLFLSVLGNILIALLVVANSDYSSVNWAMLACLAPLLFITAGFKWYCVRTFDDPIHWYQTGKMMRDAERTAGTDKKSKRDRVGVRFGHPVLYQPLITPMVSSKSQHLLKSLYTGRISHEDGAVTTDYSDVYMNAMDSNQPGKSRGTAPFEFVDEHNMDFEHYKNRPEFRNEAGGDGQLFGHSQDITRPGTPGSRMTRAGTVDSFDSHQRDSYYRSRSHSRDSERTKVNEDGAGVEYPRGYHQTPANLREHSPARSEYSDHFSRPHTRHGSSNLREQGSRTNLVSNAAVMGHAPPVQGTPMGGYGPLGRTPGIETPGYESGEETSYDYFRRGRNV
nr:uncharacterized protein CFP56_16497 [Quercus suber]